MHCFLLGSAEGFTLAEQAIASASKQGDWVLLKNVHLAPQWLKELEKKLHSLKPQESFRLFLSTEIHPKVWLLPLCVSLSLVTNVHLASDEFVTNGFVFSVRASDGHTGESYAYIE